MSRLSKALIAGLLIGILGLILSLTPVGLYLEETMGLNLLFRLRGLRKAPPEVVVVSMDRVSATKLNIPAEPEKWPRSLHARLTETLAKEGSAVIAFDIIFEEPRSVEHDNSFAKALSAAGNVVLSGYLKKDTISVGEDGRPPAAEISIETLLPPIVPLAESAAAISVFPLPKIPVRLSQYWTFKTSAGDTPTLPIVAFQVFALDVYQDFFGLLAKISPYEADKLPDSREAILGAKSVERLIRIQREIFRDNPHLAQKMLMGLKKLSIDDKKKQIIRSLIRMYQSPSSLYLNFYGPPATITTISYYHALEGRQELPADKDLLDFSGKALFVGLSENLRPEQKDGFYTVFSQASGVDISGVEIAATAFANLLDGMPVQPLRIPAHVALVLFWGVALGVFCRFFPTVLAAVTVAGLSILYLFVALYEFGYAGIWFPLVSPLFFQAPFVFFGTVLWQYFDASRERQHIRRAFGYYLPEKVVDQIARNIKEIGSGGQTVYGTCLCTDAEQYTTLSETMEPEELKRFLNKYYETLFEPVRKHGGIISDVLGDSMMALWTTTHPDAALRNQACQAALEIASAVNRFNQSTKTQQLPTRIGLHSGHMVLGNVGAIDHYEYRAVGDIVNTVGRIEGLNKQLGTQILVSADVLDQLDDFLTRELGEFLLSGKSKPVVIYELLCRLEECDEKYKDLCTLFAGGLSAYRNQLWMEASESFADCIQLVEEDGPSLFYLNMCKRYRENPPGEGWNGVVPVDKK
jgi:adenylate cyclase